MSIRPTQSHQVTLTGDPSVRERRSGSRLSRSSTWSPTVHGRWLGLHCECVYYIVAQLRRFFYPPLNTVFGRSAFAASRGHTLTSQRNSQVAQPAARGTLRRRLRAHRLRWRRGRGRQSVTRDESGITSHNTSLPELHPPINRHHNTRQPHPFCPPSSVVCPS